MMIRNITIMVVALALLTSYSFGYELLGYDWSYKSDPMGEDIEFNPNCSDYGCGSEEDQINALWQGANAWTDYAKAEFEFTYGGLTTRDSYTYDSHNIIFFSPGSSGNAIATTYWWYQSGGRMIEADIVFWDGAFSFSAYQNPTYSEFDVWNIAAHELGHVHGLGHSSVSAATMYAYSSQGETSKRTLHSDDINGAQAIYGEQDPFSVIIHTDDDSYARVFSGSGSFDFTVLAYNNDSYGHLFRATIDLELPDGSTYGPLLNLNSVYIPANSTLTYNGSQNIPGNAPAGEYKYRARMRDTSYPYDDYDVSYFMFWVEGKGVAGLEENSEGWTLTGSGFESAEPLAGEGGQHNSSAAIIPGAFELRQNVPNPFNPNTNINFDLYEEADVSLHVYNLKGQLIKTLLDNRALDFGPYSIEWDAADSDGNSVSAGIYLYKLTVGDEVALKKMTLIK